MPPKRAINLARVSTPHQAKLYSLDHQLEAVNAVTICARTPHIVATPIGKVKRQHITADITDVQANTLPMIRPTPAQCQLSPAEELIGECGSG
jgi:hypothetical protein